MCHDFKFDRRSNNDQWSKIDEVTATGRESPVPRAKNVSGQTSSPSAEGSSGGGSVPSQGTTLRQTIGHGFTSAVCSLPLSTLCRYDTMLLSENACARACVCVRVCVRVWSPPLPPQPNTTTHTHSLSLSHTHTDRALTGL